MYDYFKGLIGDVTLPELTLVNLVTVTASFFIIFGGIVPFVPQYREIKRSSNTDGFSTFVCLTLLIANTLRILFWFGHPFEIPLLLQSIVMIITMLAMVHVCTFVRAKSEIIASKPRRFSDPLMQRWEETSVTLSQKAEHQTHYEVKYRRRFRDFDRGHFWRWTDFGSYIQFLVSFTAAVGAVTYLFMDHTIYVETLGFLAVLFEALLGAPQFYRNYKNSSTQGMSIQMVVMWTTGDIFKTGYFLLRAAPAQFWLCGILQVGLDIAILTQVVVYRNSRPHDK